MFVHKYTCMYVHSTQFKELDDISELTLLAIFYVIKTSEGAVEPRIFPK